MKQFSAKRQKKYQKKDFFIEKTRIFKRKIKKNQEFKESFIRKISLIIISKLKTQGFLLKT